MRRCLIWIWPQAHLPTKSPALSVLYSEIRSSHANMLQCISWYKHPRPNRMLTFRRALTAERDMYAFQFWFLWSGSTVNTQKFSNLATPPPQSGTEANTCAVPPPPPSAVTTVLEAMQISSCTCRWGFLCTLYGFEVEKPPLIGNRK